LQPDPKPSDTSKDLDFRFCPEGYHHQLSQDDSRLPTPQLADRAGTTGLAIPRGLRDLRR